MTVCKTFKGKNLKEGSIYRRTELFENLHGFESMAATYFDPDRKDDLYTFFNHGSKDWKNVYFPEQSEFHFKHRREPKLERSPKWELQKVRHVFLRMKGMNSGDYKYLGTTTSENIKNINGFDTKVLILKKNAKR